MNIIRVIFDSKANSLNTIAIDDGNVQLSYSLVQSKIALFAKHLSDSGVKQGDVVAILLPRGIDLVLSILAIFYLGATALPLEQSTPKDRLTLTLADATYIISTLDSEFKSKLISLPDYSNSQVVDFKPAIYETSNIAYIVYTSGSSGIPKKIEISYKNLIHYCRNLNMSIDVKETDIYAFTASIGFSSMFRQIFIPILTGATLLIISEEERKDPVLFINKALRATIIDLIPSFIESLLAYLERPELATKFINSNIRLSLSASEPLKVSSIKAFINYLPNASFINMYGLTETSGIIATYPITRASIGQFNEYYVPIGSPIKETSIILVDELGQRQTEGPGELYVSTSALSSSVMLENNFYRTGDIGMYDEQNNLVYVGRSDRQIKISGKRIHLMEIDKAIESHELVKKSVTIFEEQSKRLITFVKSIDANEFNVALLKEHAKSKLSSAMHPSEFHIVEEFPLTSSRKLDYKRLTEMYYEITKIAKESNSTTTYNFECSWEKKLFEVFSELLQVYDINPNDNLLEIGADSLKIAIAMAKITSGLQIDIRLNDVFSNPTIKQLASVIRNELSQLQ